MAKANEVEKTRGNPLASAEEKKKALEAARLQIEKQFGTGSIIQLGNASNVAGIEVIPSGAILLDEALGIGGYPRGRIIEIFGPESSGKTTLALHAIAEAQKMGGIAAFVDAEHALDPVYAKNLGVNIDELWVSQPDSGEQALEITENLVRSGALDVIVVDSVAALTPQAEIDGDMGDAQMGLQARLMSQAMRKLTAIIGKSRTVLVFINQIRMKIGVMFGNPETTTGGNALKFYSSLRLEVRKTETIEGGKDADAVGNRVRVKVVKNKVAPPFRKVELEVIFGKGVSASASLLDGAVKYGIIDKKGAWYSYGEEKVGQGRDSARDYLEQNPAFAKEIEEKLWKIIFPGREMPGRPAKSAASAPVPAEAASSGPVEPAVPAAAPVIETAALPVAAPTDGTAAPVSADSATADTAAPVPPLIETPAAEPTAMPAAAVPSGPGLRKGAGLPASSPELLEISPAPARPAARPAPPPVQPDRGAGTPVHRGPGRPPSVPQSAPPVSRPAAETPHRGPGRPRKAAPGEGGDALF